MAEKIVCTFEKKSYDFTDFAAKHPGGKETIVTYAGKDITTIFNKIGHSEDAYNLMKKYAVNKDDVDVSTHQPPKDEPKRGTWAYAMKKLFTEEDKNNFHKILGVISLFSFAYRYCYLWPTTGHLGFQNPGWIDYATILVHFFLSFSSLIFHVLEKRIIKNPLIIYEEYRLHAILFTGRAMAVSLYGFYSHLLPTVWARAMLVAMIAAIHLWVDYITTLYGTPGVTAVRNTNDGSLKEIRLFFAFYQFLALGSHLILDPWTCDLGFNTVIAIQSSAFLMTLKRKSIIRWYSHVFWYTLALVLSSLYMWQVKGSFFLLYILFAFFLRTQLNFNKYLAWMVFVGGYYMALYALFEPNGQPTPIVLDISKGFTHALQEMIETVVMALMQFDSSQLKTAPVAIPTALGLFGLIWTSMPTSSSKKEKAN